MSAIHALTSVADHVYVLNNSLEQLNLQTLIGGDIYTARITKRLIIPSGIVVGSTSTSTAALIVPAGAQGRLIIENYGSIQGAGGAGGTSGTGGVGGDAISAASPCVIVNQSGGVIYAGGGGGGKGGTGGTGGQGQFTTVVNHGPSPCGGSCSVYAPSAYCSGSTAMCAKTAAYCTMCSSNQTSYTSGGSGGAGGNGGRGKGYDGNLASGSNGSAGANGGTNAGQGGTGGTGGSGGDWGVAGSTGSTGSTGANGNYTNGLTGSAGSGGGFAGYYINGLSTYVTFTNNGNIAGRSN